MKKRYKVLLALIAAALLVTIGVTFAYYVAKIRTNGEGSLVDAQTANVGDATIYVEGNIDLGTNETETDILPGHKSVAKIKVSADRGEATQDFNVNYNLVWVGINDFTTDLKYTVYKTYNKDAEINVSCSEVKEVVDTEIRVSENCKLTGINIDLEASKISGDNNIIPPTEGEEERVVLASNESILAKETAEDSVIYYFVVLEYQNLSEDQSEDMSTDAESKKIEGIVTVEPTETTEKKVTFKEHILAKTTLQIDEPDFSKTSCKKGSNDGGDCEEETIGLYCWDVDTNKACTETSTNITYFYRGNVEDNYVEFAGFYWRIIRINETGSLRLIYQGRTKDENGNKLDIQKTGSETQIGESFFNSDRYYGAFGFMYTRDLIYGFEESSIVKDVLDEWYSNNLLNYTMYMDINSGFCNDRSYRLDEFCNNGSSLSEEDCKSELGQWAWVDDYYSFGSATRLINDNPTPIYSCPEKGLNLYTVNNNVNLGNEKLTYPIALITADEVAFAGGIYPYYNDHINKSYFLYTGENYWTNSPRAESFIYDEHSGLIVYSNGELQYGLPHNDSGVRPVINVSTDNLSISGNGTIDSPYVLQ